MTVALMIPATAFAAVADRPARHVVAVDEPIVATSAPVETPTPAVKKPTPVATNAAPSPPTKARGGPEVNSVEALIRKAFGEQAEAALAVAHCESKLVPTARNPSGARGVFQIMPVHTWRIAKVGGTHLDDAKTNVAVAKAIYDDEGWRPWSCARIVGVR